MLENELELFSSQTGTFSSHQFKKLDNLFMLHGRSDWTQELHQVLNVERAIPILIEKIKDELLSSIILFVILRQKTVDSMLKVFVMEVLIRLAFVWIFSILDDMGE